MTSSPESSAGRFRLGLPAWAFAGWRDRYGPVPETAERLLDAALLRAECHRLGIRDVVTVKGPGMGGPSWIAKLGPVQLKVSQEMRLSRLFPDSVWKPNEYGADGGQVQLGIKKKREVASAIRQFLLTLWPLEQAEPEGELAAQGSD